MRHHFDRIGRERREAAEEAGDHEEPPLGRQPDAGGKRDGRDADHVAADQVRGERAERHGGKERVERKAQEPAQQRAEPGADEDRDDRIEQGSSSLTRPHGGCGLRRTVCAIAPRRQCRPAPRAHRIVPRRNHAFHYFHAPPALGIFQCITQDITNHYKQIDYSSDFPEVEKSASRPHAADASHVLTGIPHVFPNPDIPESGRYSMQFIRPVS
ncbi:hypothetical protein BDI4_290085 [Burkholderia diffusa]|nr:hypothetical protein BDI4_290085 [Burkholderia diffusa]